MERPKMTHELITAVAQTFCADNGWDEEQAADLARVCRSGHMDGYELAKELDSLCSWMPTAQDVETLDNFSYAVREAHRQTCLAWAHDNNVLPPLPIGTMTTRGEITGIYAHDAATYEVRKHGATDPTLRQLVRFEDVREAPAMAVS